MIQTTTSIKVTCKLPQLQIGAMDSPMGRNIGFVFSFTKINCTMGIAVVKDLMFAKVMCIMFTSVIH